MNDNLAGRSLARTTFGAQTVLSQGYNHSLRTERGCAQLASGPNETAGAFAS